MKLIQDLFARLLTAPGEPRSSGVVLTSKSDRSRATATAATVYLLLDISQSMNAEKLAQARIGGTVFAEDALAKGYEVGLIQFSKWPTLRTKPTKWIARLRVGMAEIGEQSTTNIAAAIDLASRELGARSGLRVIVLVTDGYPDDASAAFEAARQARENGITLIAIGTEDADDRFLKNIATSSELSTIVPDTKLEAAITNAARLLPAKGSSR